jgi:catechol 2,3-dioxygenase-like lactoylglutathione lyase family enzyme
VTIKGVHALFYTTDAEAARAFLRDKLRLPFHDEGNGWLVFDFAEGEVGCHPSDSAFQGVTLYCDDLDATMGEASARGVEFSEVVEEAWGRVTTFELPGGGPVRLYQPAHVRST